MKKQNSVVRLVADKQGNIAVSFALPPDALAKAEDMARRLETTTEDVLLTYFDGLLPSLCDGINDHCLCGGWVFRKAEQALKFMRQERELRRGHEVVEWTDGSGFGICPL